MKNLKIYGLALVLAGVATLSSCSKESGIENPVKTSASAGTDDPIEGEVAAVLVTNLLPGEITLGDGVTMRLNSEDIIESIGFKEYTSYIDVPAGDVELDVVLSDGSILFSQNVNLAENGSYTLVFEGATPEQAGAIVLPIDAETLESPDVEDILNLRPEDAEGYVFNVLNLVDLGDDNMILGMDYVDQAGEVITGLVDLPEGEASVAIFGSLNSLPNMDLLQSDLDVQGLVDEISSQMPEVDAADLEGATALFGLNDSIGDLLGSLTDALGGLFGGAEDPFTMLSEDAMDNLPMVKGGAYTVIVLGDAANVEVMVLDQGNAGN